MTLSIQPAGAIAAGVHHTFTDTTLASLVNTMSTMSEAGEARFALHMNFSHANGSITTVDLTMDLSIDMPEWDGVGSARQVEQTEWNRFMRALRAHEDGHIDIFRREASVAYNSLLAATPRTINDVLNRERRRIQRLSDVYDHQTNHGRSQNTPDGNTVITVPP